MKKTIYLKNYLSAFSTLSKWIANLGVEPWLLFLAFLLLPILVFLLLRQFFVTRVLETISILLKKSIQFMKNINNFKYLPLHCTPVKKILPLFLFSCLSLVQATEITKQIFIGRGEIKELDILHLSKFSVGNREVLKIKVKNQKKSNKQKLILKGVMVGTSGLLIWKKGLNKPTQYQVYVLSKKKQLELAKWPPFFNEIGLQAKIKGQGLSLKGTLETIEQYNKLQRVLIKSGQEWNALEVLLSDQLKSKILSSFYYLSLSSYREDLNCRFKGPYLFCYYQADLPLKKNLQKQLEQVALVKWQQFHSNPLSQYRLKITLYQFEKKKGESLYLGLNQLKGSLQEIFHSGSQYFLNQNQALFNQQAILATILAEPEIMIRPGRNVNIQIGSEVYFQTQNNAQAPSAQWKFAGLKVNINPSQVGERLSLAYETELTNPTSQNQISGNKEKSEVLIKIGTPIKLFEIGFQAINQYKTKLPWLSSIPILGKIFTSTSNTSNYKKIIAVAYLTLDEDL